MGWQVFQWGNLFVSTGAYLKTLHLNWTTLISVLLGFMRKKFLIRLILTIFFHRNWSRYCYSTYRLQQNLCILDCKRENFASFCDVWFCDEHLTKNIQALHNSPSFLWAFVSSLNPFEFKVVWIPLVIRKCSEIWTILVCTTLGKYKIAQKHVFDLADVQDEMKQQNESPGTKQILKFIFLD